MEKLKWKTIILSCAVSAVLLFGGFFATQFFNTEKPINDWFNTQVDVQVTELNISNSAIELEIKYENQPNFGQVHLEVLSMLHDKAKGKDIHVRVHPEQSDQHSFWMQHSPTFYEFLHQQQYSHFQTFIDELIEENELQAGKMTMTNDYVFVFLQPTNNEELYVVLPLNVDKGGEM